MLLLLDIDGVMVPAKGWKSPELLDDGFPAFSMKATRALQLLLAENDLGIMLTSSHKSKYNLREWKNIFNNRGIHVESIQTLPGNFNNLSRMMEIINWFNVNSVNESFVIIDDDSSLNELPRFLKEHLVLTSPLVGLTEEHIEKIQSVLRRKFQPE